MINQNWSCEAVSWPAPWIMKVLYFRTVYVACSAYAWFILFLRLSNTSTHPQKHLAHSDPDPKFHNLMLMLMLMLMFLMSLDLMLVLIMFLFLMFLIVMIILLQYNANVPNVYVLMLVLIMFLFLMFLILMIMLL